MQILIDEDKTVKRRRQKASDGAASLDRKDSKLGYVQGNVFIISYRANMIKNCGSANEHRAIAEWMEK